MITYCCHGAGYSYVWLGGNGFFYMLTKNSVNLFGLLTLIAGLVISATSCAWLRRANYQVGAFLSHCVCVPSSSACAVVCLCFSVVH
jgi:hypothetical protein